MSDISTSPESSVDVNTMNQRPNNMANMIMTYTTKNLIISININLMIRINVPKYSELLSNDNDLSVTNTICMAKRNTYALWTLVGPSG